MALTDALREDLGRSIAVKRGQGEHLSGRLRGKKKKKFNKLQFNYCLGQDLSTVEGAVFVSDTDTPHTCVRKSFYSKA